MTTLPNMGLSLPLRGAVGSGQWDDTIDGDLSIIDPHDHTIGKGARVPTAGLNINADLPFSALYAPTQLHRVQFSAIAGGALTNANNLSLFVSDGSGGLAANELYYRTSAGNAIRFTSGSSLNVSAFVGGIGGDYASVVAQLNYDDAGKRYTFKEGTGDSNGWARLAAGGLRLFEFNTTESVYVEQLAPAALAVSYAMTWPTALPGSQALVQVDNAGQYVFSNTVPNAVTFSGNVTINGALGYTDVENYSIAFAIPATGISVVPSVDGQNVGIPLTNTTTHNVLPLKLRVGATIASWTVQFRKTSASGSILAKLWKSNSLTGATQIGSTQSSATGVLNNTSLGQSGLSEVVASLTAYFISVQGGGTNGDILYDYYVTTT